jgi:hypothetical protein
MLDEVDSSESEAPGGLETSVRFRSLTMGFHMVTRFFSRANPLYVQAISTLLPPDTKEKKSVVSVVDRCQGKKIVGEI